MVNNRLVKPLPVVDEVTVHRPHSAGDAGGG
ncbi:hypothetical protein [Acinetobacter baumannii]